MLIFPTAFFAQKSLPIIFGELGIGYGRVFSEEGGLATLGSLNYEFNKNLITARYVDHSQLKLEMLAITPVTPFPIITTDAKIHELGLLYGRRYTDDGFSYSFSGGIAGYNYIISSKDENGNWYENSKTHFGVPIEFNIKWFKSAKSPYRIYELIPVGKATALGNSIGFKFFGTISKHTYLGVGLTLGIGYHQTY